MQETTLKIDDTIVELIDYGSGRGQIKVRGSVGNFSHFWGAMGEGMIAFVARINESYFLRKLNPRDNGVFCPRRTLKNVRAFVKSEIPWYECKKEQKRLREELKRLEKDIGEETAMRILSSLTVEESDDYNYKYMISSLVSEPWHYFGYKKSETDILLSNMIKKLQKRLRRIASV